jgi:hypothetical protein
MIRDKPHEFVLYIQNTHMEMQRATHEAEEKEKE